MALATAPSKTWTFFAGDWHEGNIPLMGARTHAAWLGSSVFDGARAFEGVTPDLDLHCARVNQSAQALYLSSGFRPVGQRTAYYRNPKEDALVLWLPLEQHA